MSVDDDLFVPVSGRATGANAGANAQWRDESAPLAGHVLPGKWAQVFSIRIHEQQRSREPGRMPFDHFDQFLHDLGQRRIGGDQFEQLLLPQHQRLRTFALGDVGGNAGHGIDGPVRLAQRELDGDVGVRSVVV